MTMRVLFLDIDGVLHSGEDANYWVWLPDLVQLLHGYDDVRVVVHSSWRYEHTLQELRLALGALGPRVIDTTPRSARWDSIRWWMSQNYKNVTSWRVLDDAPAQFPTPPPAELILCDPARGVSAPDVQAALRDWLDA